MLDKAAMSATSLPLIWTPWCARQWDRRQPSRLATAFSLRASEHWCHFMVANIPVTRFRPALWCHRRWSFLLLPFYASYYRSHHASIIAGVMMPPVIWFSLESYNTCHQESWKASEGMDYVYFDSRPQWTRTMLPAFPLIHCNANIWPATASGLQCRKAGLSFSSTDAQHAVCSRIPLPRHFRKISWCATPLFSRYRPCLRPPMLVMHSTILGGLRGLRNKSQEAIRASSRCIAGLASAAVGQLLLKSPRRSRYHEK